MFLLLLLLIVVVLVVLITAIDTQSNGFFLQQRIGKNGIPFLIYKLRTHHAKTSQISYWGHFLRTTKLDEVPQLLNVLKGEMTLVGPRPDLPGFADLLEGDDRLVLQLKPGITGLASLKYRNEEALLALQSDPNRYNEDVIWPDKVRINKWYALHRNFYMDVLIIGYTFFPFFLDVEIFIAKYKT